MVFAAALWEWCCLRCDITWLMIVALFGDRPNAWDAWTSRGPIGHTWAARGNAPGTESYLNLFFLPPWATSTSTATIEAHAAFSARAADSSSSSSKQRLRAALDAWFNWLLAFAVLAILVWRALGGNPGPAKAKAAARRANAPEEEELEDEEPEGAAEAVDECEHAIGEELEIAAEDLHFGLPRCRVRAPGLEALPAMLQWAPEDFGREQLQVARVFIGSFGIWVAQGMRSNRILYAMKKQGAVDSARCVVVESPVRKVEDDENDTPDTYGPDLTKVQLIP